MNQTTDDQPAWVDSYLGHRSAYSKAHPRPGAGTGLVDRHLARLEIVSLALTIADLTDQERYDHGAYCARTDPAGADETYEEAHGTVWSERAVQEEVAPVLRALRGVETAVDAVDAVRLDPELIERLFRDTAPERALDSLATVLADDRLGALQRHGLTHDLYTYLGYGHLPISGRRMLYVKPCTPWDYAGDALANALRAYASASPQRFDNAAAAVVRHRQTNARNLPPAHWVW